MKRCQLLIAFVVYDSETSVKAKNSKPADMTVAQLAVFLMVAKKNKCALTACKPGKPEMMQTEYDMIASKFCLLYMQC